MEITLHGFRCYENKTFTFPKKGIVLLEGPSGSGKTTILQSLT
jgi:DNA repair exonuclease SbcCD ATPase subunit